MPERSNGPVSKTGVGYGSPGVRISPSPPNSLEETFIPPISGGLTSYGENLRTTPGQFGARASKLYGILTKWHYGVKLSPEDMHRLTLWLDLSTMFYGVYEKESGEAQLRGEIAMLPLQ